MGLTRNRSKSGRSRPVFTSVQTRENTPFQPHRADADIRVTALSRRGGAPSAAPGYTAGLAGSLPHRAAEKIMTVIRDKRVMRV